MNLENLEIGMIVKNYKEMCRLLGQEIKGGKGKQYQVKDWERYFRYNKSGNKFIIEEIYETPTIKVDGRITGKNNIYGELAQILLIDKLANSKTKNFSISKSKLIEDLSLANTNYNGCKTDLRKLAKFLDMDVKYIYDFYNVNDSCFTGIITRALKNLEDKRIIKYNIVHKVKMFDEKTTRLMTEDELDYSNKCERRALIELGFTKVSDVRKSSFWRTFEKRSMEKFREKYNADYYYQAYQIVVDEEYLEEEKLDLINIIKCKNYRIHKNNEMNDLVLSEFDKKLHNRINDDNGKNLEFKRTPEYLNNNVKLSELLLDKNYINIVKDVQKVELDNRAVVVDMSNLPF